MNNKDAPIGIFDSGVGGLTVMKEIEEILPYESLIYLGDTARTPYGTRSQERIKKLSFRNILFLEQFKVKLVVVACNTSSAVALDYLRENFSIPIIGVIEPGVRLAVERTKNMRIGVIGTEATINAGAYQKAILNANPEIKVFAKACPLFVPLVEEGFTNGKIPELAAETYLAEFRQNNIDTLLLGCTHYPILIEPIRKIMGESVDIINSAQAVAEETQKFLKKNSMLGKNHTPYKIFYVTDAPERFRRIGERFLKKRLDDIRLVEI